LCRFLTVSDSGSSQIVYTPYWEEEAFYIFLFNQPFY
jgi:hypothetical protein